MKILHKNGYVPFMHTAHMITHLWSAFIHILKENIYLEGHSCYISSGNHP